MTETKALIVLLALVPVAAMSAGIIKQAIANAQDGAIALVATLVVGIDARTKAALAKSAQDRTDGQARHRGRPAAGQDRPRPPLEGGG
ncbi:hypothetical protein [Paracoccus suum]|uniref:hypothetical protein n=1 Tax=Paracoccus suum TaxID=2259340 RepID=UPI0013B04CA1|nr:hypothetical protein [Paracoccus suum]